jgi:regulator of cell morphogenesis and NO signaling
VIFREVHMKELKVTEIVPRERHPLIFRTFDELKAGDSFILINDHDPKPLYYQLLHERPGIFGWEYIEEGPTEWMVKITKN